MTKPNSKKTPPAIDLRDFKAVGSLLADHARKHYGVCASFCLRRNRPKGSITLTVVTDDGKHELSIGVHRITKAIQATLGDPDDAVEHGAYGLALLAIAHVMGMRFVKRSFKGPGFDFYINPPTTKASDPDDIFADSWGFEVTGIMEGGAAAVRSRLKRKRDQVAEAADILPILIAVVEFSHPITVLELQPAKVA
ncbi:hypothetical protein BH23GEM9_BH23GEM9_20040 [soil metagenome]